MMLRKEEIRKLIEAAVKTDNPAVFDQLFNHFKEAGGANAHNTWNFLMKMIERRKTDGA